MSKPDYSPSGRPNIMSGNRIVPLILALLLLLAARYYSELNAPPPPVEGPPVVETPPSATVPQATAAPEQHAPAPQTHQAPKPSKTIPAGEAASPLLRHNLSLRNQDGKVIYHGDIDLRPTLERIAAGRRLRFSHDGSTFQNREGRLPSQPAGHYREWVVPTPGEDGPGPQRLVTGDENDVWYTSDHYRTFQKIPVSARSTAPAKNQRKDE